MKKSLDRIILSCHFYYCVLNTSMLFYGIMRIPGISRNTVKLCWKLTANILAMPSVSAACVLQQWFLFTWLIIAEIILIINRIKRKNVSIGGIVVTLFLWCFTVLEMINFWNWFVAMMSV